VKYVIEVSAPPGAISATTPIRSEIITLLEELRQHLLKQDTATFALTRGVAHIHARFEPDSYSQDILDWAFKTISDPHDWRGPIDARINPSDRDVIQAAIIHFTGTKPSFTEDPRGGLRVVAHGYRKGPAGP
jgi:hypothetical protein